MVQSDGENIVINKYMLVLLVTILGGGGLFTGYATKMETATLSKSDISQVLNEELRSLQRQINQIDIKTEGVTVLLREHSRRLDLLER